MTDIEELKRAIEFHLNRINDEIADVYALCDCLNAGELFSFQPYHRLHNICYKNDITNDDRY